MKASLREWVKLPRVVILVAMKQQLVGLLDCNNFFVSCERLFRPDLVGKPVLVLSSNDGCVVARSQEVKDIGVLMGVPYFHIKDIVKKYGITTFSSHFALYRDISRRVFSVLREELGVIDQYSIDEAFFGVSGDPEDLAKHLKALVQMKVGIPVSVGIAPTKTQAKFANSLAKKSQSGVYVLEKEDWEVRAKSVLLKDIWGVGGKLELRYKQYGLHTVADLLGADPSRIKSLFGINGLRVRQDLGGQSTMPLSSHFEPQKSIMSTRSFGKETTDKSVIADAVAYHTRHVAADLRAMKHQAQLIRVLVLPSRHGDFFLRGGVKEAVLPVPTNDTIELLRVAERLVGELFEPGVPYKKAGVVVANLSSAEAGQQANLFREVDTKQFALMDTIDALNTHNKREVVVLGSRLKSDEWHTRAGMCSPAYTTRWTDIASVKAK